MRRGYVQTQKDLFVDYQKKKKKRTFLSSSVVNAVTLKPKISPRPSFSALKLACPTAFLVTRKLNTGVPTIGYSLL